MNNIKISRTAGVIRHIYKTVLVLFLPVFVSVFAFDVLSVQNVSLLFYISSVASCALIFCFAELFAIMLDKYGMKSISFYASFIRYGERKYYTYDLSFRYCKFYIDLDYLIYPVLIISIPNSNNIFVCVTKRQLRFLMDVLEYNIQII